MTLSTPSCAHTRAHTHVRRHIGRLRKMGGGWGSKVSLEASSAQLLQRHHCVPDNETHICIHNNALIHVRTHTFVFDLGACFHTLPAEQLDWPLSSVTTNRQGRTFQKCPIFVFCCETNVVATLLSLLLSSLHHFCQHSGVESRHCIVTPSQPWLLPPLHWGVFGNNGTLLLPSPTPPPHPPPHLWVPLCLLILLSNRSIIGPLSLVNVASDTSDGSFMHAAGVSREVGAGVEGGCIQWGGGSG